MLGGIEAPPPVRGQAGIGRCDEEAETGERACGYGFAAAGNARSRAKAATSASAHGQLRGNRSATRRPERTIRPATCSRRWRTRLGSASASSPSRQSRAAQRSSAWASSETSSQAWLC